MARSSGYYTLWNHFKHASTDEIRYKLENMELMILEYPRILSHIKNKDLLYRTLYDIVVPPCSFIFLKTISKINELLLQYYAKNTDSRTFIALLPTLHLLNRALTGHFLPQFFLNTFVLNKIKQYQ